MRGSLLKMKKSKRKKRQEEIEDSRNYISKRELFHLLILRGIVGDFQFRFFFLSCFLLVLLPFDYDDYDPKRFKISYKRETQH